MFRKIKGTQQINFYFNNRITNVLLIFYFTLNTLHIYVDGVMLPIFHSLLDLLTL